jgi:hypothetical protein
VARNIVKSRQTDDAPQLSLTRNWLENASGMAVNGPAKPAIYCHARGRFSDPQTQERQSFAINGLVEMTGGSETKCCHS